MLIRGREGKQWTTAGRELWPKVWQDGATAGKLLFNAMTFPWPYRADCTPLIIKNTPLTSDAILDEKSLTGLFSDQLHYNSQSQRCRSQKWKKKKIFKHKEPKKKILSNFGWHAGSYCSRLHCVIIKSKLIKDYHIWHCPTCQITALQPRIHPCVCGSEGFCPRLRKILLSCSRVFGELWQGPDKPISCSIILQSCSTLSADTHMPPCSFT